MSGHSDPIQLHFGNNPRIAPAGWHTVVHPTRSGENLTSTATQYVRRSLSGLESVLRYEIDPVIEDLFVIAAAAYEADQLIHRNASTTSDGWTRNLSLMVPVQNPDHWSNPAIESFLRACLGF